MNALIFFTLTLIALEGCKQVPQNLGPKYGAVPQRQTERVHILAVHPLHNPRQLVEVYQPLIDYLNKKLVGEKLELEASRDYGSFETKFRKRIPPFLLPNPWQTLQAIKVGYRVIAMAGEPSDFRGIFVVRRDSGIRLPSDLKGKAVSYPSATALAACIMPQFFLHEHGIDINKEIQNRYVGSQESSIMNVYIGQTAAGATWPPPWRAFQKAHPTESAALEVIWETPYLINNSFMVRDDVSSSTREQIRESLLHLQDSQEGRTLLNHLETARFLPASNRDYDVVKRYVDRFEKAVRKVETK